MRVRADLHIHTVLSPCAEVEMIPPLIVECALAAGLDLIAITDHNASANAGAVIAAARETGLKVLPGMELQTREEVHLLCLFDSLEPLAAWQAEVDAALPAIENRPDKFGEEFVVDAEGNFVRREKRLLLVSANIGLEEAARRVHQLGGMAIPAHIDRTANGLIPLLGLVPAGLQVEAFEVSPNMPPEKARERFRLPQGTVLTASSDAHWLDALAGAYTVFDLGTRTLASMRQAMRAGNAEPVIRRSVTP